MGDRLNSVNTFLALSFNARCHSGVKRVMGKQLHICNILHLFREEEFSAVRLLVQGQECAIKNCLLVGMSVKLTPMTRSAPIVSVERHQTRSLPSPLLNPKPSLHLGLYTTWQAIWCPKAWNMARANDNLGANSGIMLCYTNMYAVSGGVDL
jgi:hypothetical protein